MYLRNLRYNPVDRDWSSNTEVYTTMYTLMSKASSQRTSQVNSAQILYYIFSIEIGGFIDFLMLCRESGLREATPPEWGTFE
jgi:hypothetical protein